MGARMRRDQLDRQGVRVAPANLRVNGYNLADLDEVAEDAYRSFFNRASPYHPSKPEYKAMIQADFG